MNAPRGRFILVATSDLIYQISEAHLLAKSEKVLIRTVIDCPAFKLKEEQSTRDLAANVANAFSVFVQIPPLQRAFARSADVDDASTRLSCPLFVARRSRDDRRPEGLARSVDSWSRSRWEAAR